MKKYLYTALLLFCGFGLFFFLRSGQIKVVQVADVLPEDVVLYIEQHDFVETYQEFAGSRLGRVLTHIDYVDIAVELGGDKDDVAEALRLWKEIDKLVNEPAFDQVLGKEFALALFPMPGFSKENIIKNVEERLLLIARPRHNAKILQFLASKNFEQSTVQYGSHTITRFMINEEYTLSTATLPGLLLAAVDERLVRKSLSTFDDPINTLGGSAQYQQLRENFTDATLFKYLSLSPLKKQGELLAENLSESDKQQWLDLLEQWNGWNAAAYGAWDQKGVIKERLEILYSPEKLDKNVARIFATEPEQNNTLSMVPADSLFYYWGNNLNLSLFFDMYSEMLVEQHPGILDLLQQELQDTVDMRLEDILALAANECGIIIEDVEREGVPLPKVLMMLELKDTEKFMQIFHRLLAEASIPISTSEFQGHEINYWGVTPQEGLQPAFTLSGNYLLLSNSRDLVKQVLVLQENPMDTLVNNPELKELQGDLTQSNNSTAYIHIALMADAFKTLTTWAGGMAVLQGPDTAHKVNVIIEELVLPLLDGITMYTQLATRTEVKEESIVVESSILVVD